MRKFYSISMDLLWSILLNFRTLNISRVSILLSRNSDRKDLVRFVAWESTHRRPTKAKGWDENICVGAGRKWDPVLSVCQRARKEKSVAKGGPSVAEKDQYAPTPLGQKPCRVKRRRRPGCWTTKIQHWGYSIHPPALDFLPIEHRNFPF